MNCWTSPGRPLGRGSRAVKPTVAAPSVVGAVRARDRAVPATPPLHLGTEVQVVHRRRALRAVVVHLAERWRWRHGRLEPKPHYAPRASRRIGLAVHDPSSGAWTPVAVLRSRLRAPGWRPPHRGLPWSRESVGGRADSEPYAWRALEERVGPRARPTACS